MRSNEVDVITEALERVRAALCTYSGSSCDCKYGGPGQGEQTGCPEIRDALRRLRSPIPMRLHCPICRALHVDLGEFETKPHHTHACQECGHVWRPAVVATVGVRFLPGFQNVPLLGVEPRTFPS